MFCNLPRLLKMSATWESCPRPLRQTKAYSQKEQWTKYPHLLVEYDSWSRHFIECLLFVQIRERGNAAKHHIKREILFATSYIWLPHFLGFSQGLTLVVVLGWKIIKKITTADFYFLQITGWELFQKKFRSFEIIKKISKSYRDY